MFSDVFLGYRQATSDCNELNYYSLNYGGGNFLTQCRKESQGAR